LRNEVVEELMVRRLVPTRPELHMADRKSDNHRGVEGKTSNRREQQRESPAKKVKEGRRGRSEKHPFPKRGQPLKRTCCYIVARPSEGAKASGMRDLLDPHMGSSRSMCMTRQPLLPPEALMRPLRAGQDDSLRLQRRRQAYATSIGFPFLTLLTSAMLWGEKPATLEARERYFPMKM
jgi:hypothetical protein